MNGNTTTWSDAHFDKQNLPLPMTVAAARNKCVSKVSYNLNIALPSN